MPFDVIIIGSGFGGAITACRLSQAGYRVLVLERGRRWDKTNFPRKPEDRWLWSHDRPESENGWLDLRMFPGMSVAAGAAVGGGSLIYANISCEAPQPDLRTRLVPRDHLPGAEAPLRRGRRFHGRAARPRQPVDRTHEADEGRSRRPGPRRSLQETRPRRHVRPQLDLRSRLRQGRARFDGVHKQARRTSRNLRSSRQL